MGSRRRKEIIDLAGCESSNKGEPLLDGDGDKGTGRGDETTTTGGRDNGDRGKGRRQQGEGATATVTGKGPGWKPVVGWSALVPWLADAMAVSMGRERRKEIVDLAGCRSSNKGEPLLDGDGDRNKGTGRRRRGEGTGRRRREERRWQHGKGRRQRGEGSMATVMGKEPGWRSVARWRALALWLPLGFSFEVEVSTLLLIRRFVFLKPEFVTV